MPTRPPTPQQRWLQRATFILAVLTIGLGAVGIGISPAFHEVWQVEGAWMAATELLFDAATLLTLSEPTRPPANAVFGCARVAAVLFALVAASTIVLGVSQALRTGLALRYIKWYSRRHPETAHAVVFGAGPQARQVVDDIQKRSIQQGSTQKAAVQRAAAQNGAASGPDAESSHAASRVPRFFEKPGAST